MIIKLPKKVVKFLRETGTVWIINEEETFVVNNSWYKPTDVKNIYTVEFLKQEYKNDNN